MATSNFWGETGSDALCLYMQPPQASEGSLDTTGAEFQSWLEVWQHLAVVPVAVTLKVKKEQHLELLSMHYLFLVFFFLCAGWGKTKQQPQKNSNPRAGGAQLM